MVRAFGSGDAADELLARALELSPADPRLVFERDVLAAALGGRAVPIRAAVVRALMWASWKLRVQPSDPGWLDIATTVPLMSTERARAVLGWAPTVSAPDALAELLGGLASAHGNAGSPPLGEGGARRAF